jgi:hypothetical protein
MTGGTMATHLKVTAVLFLIIGALLVCVALLASVLFGVLGGVVGASADEDAGVAVAFLGLTGAIATTVLLALAVPYFVCGWGLLKRRSWARVMGIILAAIALPKFPIGTVFGVYALIILFQKDTEKLLV